jgi:D-alanine-D-alanine ligase
MVATSGYPAAAALAQDTAVAATLAIARKKVLHLVGSRQDEFMHDLSVLYSKACDDCPALDRNRYEFLFAHVHLDGSWSFPKSLAKDALKDAKPMSHGAAIAHITEEIKPDVMVPHMFCSEGMTRYRSLFDLLKIPFLGNKDYTIWPSTDKATTKQILGSAGVLVPQGDLLVKGKVERPSTAKVPFVVKACNEDNSRGLSLVRREEDVTAAIKYAFEFDSRVVVEEYIAGREVRAAVVEEEDGTLTVLPKIEYFLEDIRTSAHKLATSADGKLSDDAIKQAKKDGDRQCPADLSPEIHSRIDEAVKKAHQTLKCRHYSLFDIRVSEDGWPYILEACLFCSFSPLSVIPAMAAQSSHEHLRHPNFFHSLLERTMKEHASTNNLADEVPTASKACGDAQTTVST